ncbi:MAG: hypothetical protein Q8R37_04480 [Nanoarchaeota archaeon]|nr:hypothetical protein [Nanoarchaeota archaeon]
MTLVDLIDSFLRGRDESGNLIDSMNTNSHDAHSSIPSYSSTSPVDFGHQQNYSFFNDAGYWLGFFSRKKAVIEVGKFLLGQHFLGGVGMDLDGIAEEMETTEHYSSQNLVQQSHNNYLFAGKINPHYNRQYIVQAIESVLGLQDFAKECLLLEYTSIDQISGRKKTPCVYFYVTAPSLEQGMNYVRKDLGLDHLFTGFKFKENDLSDLTFE